MLMLAVALTASINIEIDLGKLFGAHARRGPQVTCGITTVGYRFIGKEGQQFRYAGETWVIPEEGWIELIADRRRKIYAIHGKTVPVGDLPHDGFGFQTVILPEEPKPEEGR